MIGQISLFDWMPQPVRPFPDINMITEEEAVRIIGQELNVQFTWDARLRYWKSRMGRLRLSLEYDHFNLPDNHDLFIGTGYEIGTSGGGAPCSGIAEAVKYFQHQIDRYGIKKR